MPDRPTVTEKELAAEFEKYRKLFDELYLQYGLFPPSAESPQPIEEPAYTAEATFSYEIHASA